eukprot:CAMPEP_0204891866 /NCGR_PEP_ID=MMETSP1349-20130617/28269_1 /ASSEMBLY_ACC=CAM_ASM_000710 /TAXON_ID=215587 /ORGANISM="Aplanochytrium stocchinoi, Strain GSBS06" /LENGTH=63 /DNA_ID=CAMNT_0052057513 /DNA_START=8 /DNA_END=199 /DNA_ORIENTATION=-
MRPAILVAEAVFKAVHFHQPPRRFAVNVSYEMRLASVTPQIILDHATALGMKFHSRNSKPKVE